MHGLQKDSERDKVVLRSVMYDIEQVEQFSQDFDILRSLPRHSAIN